MSYSVRSFEVRAGEPIRLTFINPDAVPHNWALIKPGSTARVGAMVNRIIAEPDAVARHYIPRTDLVLVYTDVVGPQDQFTDLVPRPGGAGPLPVSLHVSRPLDGHERRDAREVGRPSCAGGGRVFVFRLVMRALARRRASSCPGRLLRFLRVELSLFLFLCQVTLQRGVLEVVAGGSLDRRRRRPGVSTRRRAGRSA